MKKKKSTYNCYQKSLIKTKAALMLAWPQWLEGQNKGVIIFQPALEVLLKLDKGENDLCQVLVNVKLIAH